MSRRKLTPIQRRVLIAIERDGYESLRNQLYNSRWAIYYKLGRRGYVRHARVETPGPDEHTLYVNWRPVLTDKGRKAVQP